MRPAEPRRKANGVAAIRPARIGVSSGIRPRWDSSTAATACGREPSRSSAECTRRGLLTTGSADFHAPDHRLFSRFRAFDLFGLAPHLGPIA